MGEQVMIETRTDGHIKHTKDIEYLLQDHFIELTKNTTTKNKTKKNK